MQHYSQGRIQTNVPGGTPTPNFIMHKYKYYTHTRTNISSKIAYIHNISVLVSISYHYSVISVID